MQRTNNSLKIKLLNIILNYINARGWSNYDSFAENLVEQIIENFSKGDFNLDRVITKSTQSFFRLNPIKKKSFMSSDLARKITDSWNKALTPSPLRFRDIFPEIQQIADNDAIALITKLDINERIIQDALRKALRTKGATNMVQRKSDSSLEIADIEDFVLQVHGRNLSFTSVVKGYGSVGSKVRLEDVSHQIMKAYNGTFPDHVILVLAKPPVDGVITNLVRYGESVGNRDLIVLVDPVDLARFLRCQHVI